MERDKQREREQNIPAFVPRANPPLRNPTFVPPPPPAPWPPPFIPLEPEPEPQPVFIPPPIVKPEPKLTKKQPKKKGKQLQASLSNRGEHDGNDSQDGRIDVVQPSRAVTRLFLVDRQAVLDYWICLDEHDRRTLITADRDNTLKKMKAQYVEAECDCADCLKNRWASAISFILLFAYACQPFDRSHVEAEIMALYEVFIEDLEEFVSRFHAGLEEVHPSIPSDQSTSDIPPALERSMTIHFPGTHLNSNSPHSTQDFMTRGPAFTQTSATTGFFCPRCFS